MSIGRKKSAVPSDLRSTRAFLDTHDRDPWLEANVAVVQAILAVMVILLGRQCLVPPEQVWSAWSLAGLTGLAVWSFLELACMNQWLDWKFPFHLLPVFALSVPIAQMYWVSSAAFMWVIPAMFIAYIRLPRRRAMHLSVLALLVSMGCVYAREGNTWMLARVGLSGAFSLLLFNRVLSASHAIARRLKDTSNTLDECLQSMAQGYVQISQSGRIVRFNHQVCKMLQLPVDMLISKPTLADVVQYQTDRGDFGVDHANVPEQARAYVRDLGRHLQSPQHYTRKTIDGRYLDIESHVMPSGDTVRTYTDVTAYELSKIEAQAASHSKGVFLANMSHEIRTPMNGILGMLELLKGSRLDSQQAEFLERADGATRSLLGILNDILDFSKVEAGKLDLDPQPFEVATLKRDLETVLMGSLGGKPIQLRFVIDPALPRRVIGDENRLKQVLINLGGNAIKFTERGEVRVSVHLQDQSAEHVDLAFSVHDTGIGISAEQQSHIFDSFAQADVSTARRYGGTGLGLAISKRIVERMGGRLQVCSTPGFGSQFSFQVRMAPCADRQEAPVSPCAATPTKARLDGLRLLLVEDNRANQFIAMELLKRRGAQVKLAENGQQAIKVLQHGPTDFDLVLMDMQMPEMDGLEATRHIRQQLHLGQLPVIAMTANVTEADRQACSAAGMDDHIGKPLNIDALVEAVLRLAQPAVPAG